MRLVDKTFPILHEYNNALRWCKCFNR